MAISKYAAKTTTTNQKPAKQCVLCDPCSIVRAAMRMVEFSDGRHPSHGKFLSKPDRFPVGSEVRLKFVEGDVWEPVGDYDRRGRLIE